MSSKDTIIILASVGTTIIRAKESTYDLIMKELADYSGMEVLQVFTDDHAAHAMNDNVKNIYTVEEALEKAISLKYSKVIVVPVFMTKGQLYNELKSRLDFYLDRLDIKMADSVLYDADSCREFVEIFETIRTIKPEKNYLFVEHGNPYYHCAANTYLQKAFEEKGYNNVKVIQLKERDSFGQAVSFLKERKADETGAQLIIVPIIVAWGDYMADELYNSQDSFVFRLKNAGYRAIFTGEGLGEFEQFRKIYLKRLDAVKE
ncbi:MAG: sirohydrochlorin cobaltochelatase [Lachnospiraceae bacterium]|nr:sirohydrochlorin cobaltochelatase [Lachnospiraceae bacterium]